MLTLARFSAHRYFYTATAGTDGMKKISDQEGMEAFIRYLLGRLLQLLSNKFDISATANESVIIIET